MVCHLLVSLPLRSLRLHQPSLRASSRVMVSPSSTSPVALSVATAWQRLGFSLSSKTKRSGEKRPLALTVAIRNLLLQVGRPWIGVMFCITTSGERRMRAAISRAIRLLARPCCPW